MSGYFRSSSAIFQDRHDAGEKLAEVLARKYANDSRVLIYALPRGGVPVAYPVAERLGAPLGI